jgi:hypothetical protein
MRSSTPAVVVLVGMAVACRPAEAPAPPPSSAELELEGERLACERGEPGACDLHELERARRSCEQGMVEGCDHFELVRAICLEHPDGPLCDRLRQRGELPPEPPPLADAFGCRSTEGPIGPHAVVCLAADRVSIRDSAGRWEQWQVERWRREDTREHAIRVAELVDGAPLSLTMVEAPPAARVAPFAPSTAYHVAGNHGLLRATLGARDPEAEDALAELPTVEEVCRHADACERAIAAARPRAPSPDGEEGEVAEPTPSVGPHTLRHCHSRWFMAANAHLEQHHPPSLPDECGSIRDDAGFPIVIPPHDTPAEPW